MDRTLDSIRPSDVEGANAEMSYLYGRDPSILAFGQRPIPSSKQNLISLYEDEEMEYSDQASSTASTSINLQTVKVYLRMKPLPRKFKLTKEEADAYRITSPTTLVTKLPTLDHTFSSLKAQKSIASVCRKFTFSRTFGPETTQLELFDEVIQPRMVDFLGGQNCTVMTYGTTNSGKSYTLQGTTTSPGIIPRGLEFVFSNINPRPTPCYKPTHSSNVISLNAVDRAQELEAKNKLLTFASIDKHHYINAYKQMQKLLQEESPIRASQAYDAHYSVWVSFAEIYNENIYDLLSNDCQKRRPLLKLGADSHDRAFIKGLKTISVNSGSEAYQVLMAGQYNLKVAATALNARSSRSHCIFTIQLLKYYGENDPESVEISTFTFCDLAGSERLKKTLNVGDRLKEAQNINTSLLVLGRCLKTIYEGQSTRQRQEQHIGPFRESKLTRLFQRALSGKEQIALIVNVNPIPNMYIETQNVLNFSAIAKKIVVEPKKIFRRASNSRFSKIVAQSVKSNTDWDAVELCDIVENTNATVNGSVFINPEDYDDLVDENKSLKKEIGSLKASMLEKDLQIRQELTDTYTAMMKKLEIEWKNRIKDVEAETEDHFEWRVNMVEAFYKDKINEITSNKRRRTDESCNDEQAKDITELEIENSRLQSKVHMLKKTRKQLRDKNETLLTEKNKIAFEMGLANDEIKSLKSLLSSAQTNLCKDDESIAYVEQLRKQLSDQREYIKKLKECLNEAKGEYISITSDAMMMENRLKERDEELAEMTESIADLKLYLENTNACLEEKTKATDVLEEKVQQQANLMLIEEEKNRKKDDEYLEIIRELKEKIASLEESSSSSEKPSSDSKVPAIDVKKEIISESEGDSSTEFPKTIAPDRIFIKTDNDQVLGIPSSTYDDDDDDDRNSEMFVQVREITLDENIDESVNERPVDMRRKRSETENENCALKKKLSESLDEIESLKESLDSMKNKLNDATLKPKELQDAQDRDRETKARNDESLSIEKLEEFVSLKDFQSQTSMIAMREDGNQTEKIDDFHKSVQTSFVAPIGHDKSVQTTVYVNEELMNMEKLLVVLQEKCNELEADSKEKQLSILQLERDIEKNREAKDLLEQQSNEDRESIRSLNDALKSSENKASAAFAEVDSAKQKLNDSEENQKKLHEQISKAHAEKISQLERTFAEKTKEHEEKIDELNKCVERCKIENKQLEERLCENRKESEALRKRLQQADKRDQEKDDEIRTLQKSYKARLAADMNEESKKDSKELLEIKESLARTDEIYQRLKVDSKKEIESLELQNSALEKRSKMCEIYQQKAQHEKSDAERLRTERDELKTMLKQKELEMESFTTNRDTMILRYETLVKGYQEELALAKREIMRLQEHFQRMPTTPRGKVHKVEEEENKKSQISVVDLSDSETKRQRRQVALPPPPSETKRSTRKKKLFTAADQSCVDIEPCDAIPPTPSPLAPTRKLRNRKK